MWWSKRKNSVLLVDFDDVAEMVTPDVIKANISSWLTWLENGSFDPQKKRRKFLRKRVYWNSPGEIHRAFFESIDFEAFACPAQQGAESATDIIVSLDAMDLAAGHSERVEEIILLSSSPEFAPVANRLRDKYRGGIRVDVVVMTKTGTPTQQWWSDFQISAEEFLAALQAQPAVPAQVAPAALAPAANQGASRNRRRRTNGAAAEFNLEHAADLVVAAARARGSVATGSKTIVPVLRNVAGFTQAGKEPYLGCGTYNAMVLKFVELRPKHLKAHRPTPTANVAVRYIGPNEP